MLIWALSAALATAPLAPAWAMARNTAPIAGSDGISLASSADAREVDRGISAPAGHASHSNQSASDPSAAHRPAANHSVANHSVANEINRAQPLPSLADSRHLAHATHADSRATIADMQDRSGRNADQTATACSDGACDGQCCGVCILTLGAMMPFTKIVALGANDSPSYRAHAFTSFVPTPIGRPPQL